MDIMRKRLCSVRLVKLGLVILLSVGFINSPLADEKSSSSVITEYYWIEDGKVDASTFIGWSLFHNTCVSCHGVGGGGTELAPDLTKSIEKLSPVEFTTKVFHRYSMPVGDRTDMTNAIMAEVQKDAQRDSGELERMPQWKSNPLVRAHVLNIYGYLKARHDGVIGPERPELMPTQD
jgi:mono/diheme cytochrome c family protein